MKRLFILSLLIGYFSLGISLTIPAQVPYSDLEIVESIPEETNLDNPDVRNTLEVWLEMIGNAKKTLDIEQFYVSTEPGEPLEKVIQAILEAAERGVPVRFIADSKFYKTYPETLDLLDSKENIEVRKIDFGKLGGGGIQHAKFFIVDGEQVFFGSQNFDWRALKHIHEIGVRIHHPAAASAYLDIFNLDWQLCQVDNPEEALQAVSHKDYPVPFRLSPEGEDPVEFYPVWAPRDLSPNEDLWSLGAILKLIEGAKRNINIELLSYSPIGRNNSYWPELDVALRQAAARKVQVRMIVADWGKTHPKVDHLKSLQMVPHIDIKFSTIPPHSSGHIPYARVTHAKFMTVDDEQCWVGCSNWEKNYYYSTRDVGVVIKSQKFLDRLQSIFDKDWQSEYTELIQPEREYQPPQVGP